MSDNGNKRLILGVIGKAHGIRGEVRVRCFLGDPADLDAYGPLTSADGRLMLVEHLRVLSADMAVVRFQGIGDRNGAETLNGLELGIARSILPATEDEDSFYHADLIGLDAVTQDGVILGKVVAVHDFGAGDILDVRGTAGQAFYSFTKAVVPSIDLAAGRLTIVPPDEISAEEG